MKNRLLIVASVLGIMATVACHKAAPLATKAVPSPAPSAAATASTTQSTPSRPSVATKAANTPTRQPERRTAMTAQERSTLSERLAKLEDALFDYDKATIRADAVNALRSDVDVIRDILSRYPSQKLRIEGYADERGSSEYNLGLGDRRAAATKEFLNTMGIPSTQLAVISYGKERPVRTASTEVCWQKNRRAHVTAAD